MNFLPRPTYEDKLRQQAQAYHTVAAACQAVSACFRLTTWGFTDAWSFRGVANASLPWDTEYRAKPAWQALQQVLRPTPAPFGNRAPTAPGAPVASGTTATGRFTLTWSPALEQDGHPVTYRLEHKDADDAAWTTLWSGIRTTSWTFRAEELEQQGTWQYRVVASDGWAEGLASAPSSGVVVDRSAPRPPLVRPDRAAEDAAGGWFRDTVTMAFAGNGDPLPDGSEGTGVDPASLPAAVTFASTGTHTASGTVRDRAGNTSAVGSATVRVDADAPGAAASATTGGAAYRPGTWARSDVIVRFTCTDAASGGAAAVPDAVVATEGRDQRRAGVCRDRVGHATTAEVADVDLDRTGPRAPHVHADRAPDLTVGGAWFRDGVTVAFTDAGDPAPADGSAGSGTDPATLPAPRTLTTSGTHVVSGSVADVAGNRSDERSLTVGVDATAPFVALSCPATVEQGEAATATWTASDAHAGLATPADGTVALDTTTPGSRTVTTEARDRVGHPTSATCTYTVREPAPGPDPAPAEPPADEPPPADEAAPTAPAPPSRSSEPSTATPPSAGTATVTPIASPAAPPAPAPPAPLRPAAPTAPLVDHRGGLRFVVRCPAPAGATCRGRLVVRTLAERGGRPVLLGTRAFAVPRGARRTVVVRLRPAARRLVARLGRVRTVTRVELAGGPPQRWALTLRA